MLLFGSVEEAGEQRVTLLRDLKGSQPGASEVVVLARWTLLLIGDGLFFPFGADEIVALETAHGGIDGPAGQTRDLHDAEAIDGAGVNGFQDHGGGMGELCLSGHGGDFTYVAIYLTRWKVVCYIGYSKIVEDSMLEVQHITKRYRGIAAVDDVSFRVASGEVVGYLGPNGSGKSTTVKIITGILEPSAGHVLFEGRDIREDMPGYRRVLGYVPEEAHVYTHLSGLEYLQLVGRLRGMEERPLEKRATRLLELLWLRSSRHSPISSYSKGMKQRVLLAAALLHDPKLLVFDEPLSGLDVVSARLFKDLLEELASEGKAILYISHVLEVVEQVCSRVIVLSQGKMLADAPPAELRSATNLSSLEHVFAQLVQQQETRSIARGVVEAIRGTHG